VKLKKTLTTIQNNLHTKNVEDCSEEIEALNALVSQPVLVPRSEYTVTQAGPNRFFINEVYRIRAVHFPTRCRSPPCCPWLLYIDSAWQGFLSSSQCQYCDFRILSSLSSIRYSVLCRHESRGPSGSRPGRHREMAERRSALHRVHEESHTNPRSFYQRSQEQTQELPKLWSECCTSTLLRQQRRSGHRQNSP
jgi:hypothetical protein